MKRIVALSLVSLFLIVVVGCSPFEQSLEIYPNNVSGMVNDNDGGLIVKWSVSGGEGVLSVDFGDGIEAEIVGDGNIIVEHLYVTKGRHEVSFIRMSARGLATTGSSVVNVDAPNFVLKQPFWTQGNMVSLWEEILFDPFPRIIHCNNPDSYKTGLWPVNESYYQIPGPYGDMFNAVKMSEDFEMRIYVTTTDGERGNAYGKNGEVITGEWVSLQLFRVLADWPWAKPPYPLKPLQKYCDFNQDDQWVPPVIPGDAKSFLVRQEVRSKYGVLGSTQFNIFVVGGCSSQVVIQPDACK